MIYVILSREANSASKESKRLLSGVVTVLGKKSRREFGFRQIKNQKASYTGDKLGGN